MSALAVVLTGLLLAAAAPLPPPAYTLQQYMATRHAERVSTGTGLLRAVAASHDGRLLAVEDVRSEADNDILIVDLTSRTTRNVTPHTGTARFAVIGFSHDDRTVYCRSDEPGEF